MRVVTDERGAVAVMVAFLIVPLIGFGALAVDVSSLYQEKRELQNGADSASLAVAKDCATATGCIPSIAQSYADSNADDGRSGVDEVCGTGAGIPVCADPPTVPAGTKYVRVTTDTFQVGGADPEQMNFILAPVLELIAAGDFDGKAVEASAVAAWGPPSGAATLPLTFSQCEFNKAIAVNPLQTGPNYTGDPSVIYFHGTDSADIGCGATSPGGDFPGGFGWLGDEEATECGSTIDEQQWVGDKTGLGLPCKKTVLDALLHDGEVGKTVLLPIFDECRLNSGGSCVPGSNGEYHIVGFAAFHITGFNFSGLEWNMKKCPAVVLNSAEDQVQVDAPVVPGESKGPKGPEEPKDPKPSGDDRCIEGYFTKFVTTGDAFGSDNDMGVTIIKLVG